MILDHPPPDWKRPAIPLGIKLAVMFHRYGKHHFHHEPGLWDRRFDTETNDTIPPANDASKIEAVTIKEHDVIENGPGGEKRITTAGSASNRRAKGRSIRDRVAEFNSRMAAKVGVETEAPAVRPKQKRRWPKRKMQSKNTFRRRST